MRSSILCWLTTIVFMASNVLDILVMTLKRDSQTNVDRETYLQLLPDNIEQEWANRIDQKTLLYAAGYLNAAFWILFCLPIIELSWVLSRSGTQALVWNAGMVVFALGGAWTEWFSTIFWVGLNISSVNLSENFNLDVWLRADLSAQLGIPEDDGLGWRDLELNHIVSSGMVWFISAFEWLCLAGIFIFSFFSVLKWRSQDPTGFGPRWNALGLFIGLLALVEFVIEILLFEGFTVAGPILLLYVALNRLVLIPAWIVSLGYQLPRATEKHFESHNEDYFVNGEDLALSSSGVPPLPTFTIDDGDGYANSSKPQQQPTPQQQQLQQRVQMPSPPKSPPPTAFKGPSSPPAEAFAATPPMVVSPSGTD
jgi:hypothetical protein